MSYGMVASTYQLYAAPPPPPSDSWELWNGSGNTPFLSVGAGYAFTDSTVPSIVTVPIDSSRILIIKGGAVSSVDSSYIPMTCQTARLNGTSRPILTSDPLELDSDMTTDNGRGWIRGINVSDGKIYVYYSWYSSPYQVSYAKIINIDSDNNITFGARSAQIGTSTPSNSAVAMALSNLGNGHPIHCYWESATHEVFMIPSTINVDDTITLGTIKDTTITYTNYASVGLDYVSPTTIVLFINNLVIAYPSVGSTIGNPSAAITVFTTTAGSYVALQALETNKIVIVYDHYDDSFNFVQITACALTYDDVGHFFTKGPDLLVVQNDANVNGALYTSELLDIGNSGEETILTYLLPTDDSTALNCFATCLTPTGLTLAKSPAIQINANAWDSIDNYYAYGFSQSAVMSPSLIISPHVTYDGNSNCGLTVLNQANLFTAPALVFRMQANQGYQDDTIAIGIGNATGAMGATTLTIPDDLTTTFVTGIIFFEDEFTLVQSHVVTSSSFDGTNTTVNFATPLYNDLSDTTIYLGGVYGWDSDGSGVFGARFINASGGEKIYLAEINGQPSMLETVASDSSNLVSGPIAAGDPAGSLLRDDVTLFLVFNAVIGILLDISNDAAIYPAMYVTPDTADLFPPVNTPVELTFSSGPGLRVLTVIRQNGLCSVYQNGTLLTSGTKNVFALGSSWIVSLFVASGNSSYGVPPCYISDVQMWAGALGNTQRAAIEAALMTQYNIT